MWLLQLLGLCRLGEEIECSDPTAAPVASVPTASNMVVSGVILYVFVRRGKSRIEGSHEIWQGIRGPKKVPC